MCVCKCSQHGNCLLSDSILIYIFTNSGRVNLTFYTVNCSYCRPNLAELPGYMLEDQTDLSPRLRTLELQKSVSVLNLSKEPLKVEVKKATERRDVCSRSGLQVPSV
jgi:hypothetical protein